MSIPDNAILIGPWCAGKTTLGRKAAQGGSTPFVDLDDLAERYWNEIGYSLDGLLERNREVGMFDSEREWEPARAHAVLRGLEDHPTGILALGAAYTNYLDFELFEKIQVALECAARPIVLITPSLDERKCREITERRAWDTRGPEWVIQRQDLDSWSTTTLDNIVAEEVIITRRRVITVNGTHKLPSR